MVQLTLDRVVAPTSGSDPGPVRGQHLWWVVPSVVAAALIARLPFLSVPAGADEAGYLQVAAQWSRGGGSLYGHYWVDRPPLLISIYQVANAAGGLTALRLIGCFAVAATVLLVARTSDRIGGRQAARWSAVVAGAFLVTPLLGAQEVNGELLSAPFVALGILAVVEAARAPRDVRRTAWACTAGAAGVAALLVKQNIVDVLVFGSVFLVVQVWVGRLPVAVALRVAGGALLGGLGTLALTGVWTALHGTSLVGVFDAMYPFRLHAAQVLASQGSQYAAARFGAISGSWLISGLAPLTVLLVAGVARARMRNAALTALLATVAYDTFSVVMGGGYWLHYLVELVVPLALVAGLLATRRGQASRLVALAVCAVSLVTTAAAVLHPWPSTAARIGVAIARVEQPGDTLTTLYGQSEVNLAAGLPSPYEHLWSLPIKTLDPRLEELDAVLRGGRSPTWLVVTHRVASWGLDSAHTAALIASEYHPVAALNGETIYLLDTAVRATPDLPNPSPAG